MCAITHESKGVMLDLAYLEMLYLIDKMAFNLVILIKR